MILRCLSSSVMQINIPSVASSSYGFIFSHFKTHVPLRRVHRLRKNSNCMFFQIINYYPWHDYRVTLSPLISKNVLITYKILTNTVFVDLFLLYSSSFLCDNNTVFNQADLRAHLASNSQCHMSLYSKLTLHTQT